MDKPETIMPIDDWISRTCRFASPDEEVVRQMGAPQMQALLTALQLVGQVVADPAWMENNDPGKKLVTVLETLVHVTRVRQEGLASSALRVHRTRPLVKGKNETS